MLSSLTVEVRPNHDLEIIVVDNHSDDEQSQGFIKDNPDVRVYSSEGNFGYSHGCNQGALHARGNWLLFMNPDVLADWKSLSRLLNAATTDSVHAIYTARQLNEAGRLQRSFAPFTSPITFSPLVRALIRFTNISKHPYSRDICRESEKVLTVDWVSGSLLLISRDNFEQIRGWDEDYWLYCEDEDLCKRAYNAGLLSAQYCGATFIHSHGSSTRANPEIRVLSKSEAIISKYLYISKHFNGSEKVLAMVSMTAIQLSKLLIWGGIYFLSRGSIKISREKYLIHLRVCKYLKRSRKNHLFISDKSNNHRAA